MPFFSFFDYAEFNGSFRRYVNLATQLTTEYLRNRLTYRTPTADIYCWLDDVVENSRLLMTNIHINSAKRYFCFVFSFKLRLRPLRNELEDEIPDPSS